GLQWLSIPVGSDLHRQISNVSLQNPQWQQKHWKTLSHLYGKAPFFNTYRAFLEQVYLNRQWRNLSDLNQFLIKTIASTYLGISTTFQQSSDFPSVGRGQERVLSLLKSVKADLYISGPAGKTYLDPV